MSNERLARRNEVRASGLGRLKRMIEIQEFEHRINGLFAEGLIHGTTHLCLGQEALAVGLAAVTRNDDVVAATYRGHGIALAMGMTVESILAEIMGKATGCTGGVGGSMHLCANDVGVLPTSAIVGAGMPIAVGAAIAFDNRGEDRVAVSVFGDGGSNIGAFHESLNMAAVWKLPVVFVCDNNLYGEYSRINLTTSIEDIHLRAAAYGIPGVVVDGMDIDAVEGTLGNAIERARSGGGPTLVEAKTYRFAGHSRADQATYRPDGEMASWLDREPVGLTTRVLVDWGETDADAVQALRRQVREELEESVARATAAPDPDASAMFDHIYATTS